MHRIVFLLPNITHHTLSRFDAPSNLSAHGTWLGGIAIKDDLNRNSTSNPSSVVIGSPHNFYHYSKDPTLHTYNQLQEFKRRMSKSGSSGSESDVEISESYRKRLAERAAIIATECSPSAYKVVPIHRRFSESQDGPLATNESGIEGRRESFASEEKPSQEISSNRFGNDPVAGEARRKSEALVAAAVTTMDRRLRRPLKARESESMLLLNE